VVLDDHSRFNLVTAACPDERRDGVFELAFRTFTIDKLDLRTNNT
jgi:hypothetical protein